MSVSPVNSPATASDAFPAPSAAAISDATRGAIAWARDTLADTGTVYLDTETTGLDSAAEIIEIAILDHRGEVLYASLVRPEQPIPADATRVHGLTNAHVRSAPAWADVWPAVAAQISGRRVVVYNAPFDYRMLRQANARCGLPVPSDDWQCAMRQYSEFAAVWHARYGNFRWFRLDDALQRFTQRPAPTAHRAAADAAACHAIVAGMAAAHPPAANVTTQQR